MSREAKVNAVLEAAERYTARYQDALMSDEAQMLFGAVRALHQPEPKWRAQGLGDIYGPDKANVVCYTDGDFDSMLRARVLRLLLADEAKEGK